MKPSFCCLCLVPRKLYSAGIGYFFGISKKLFQKNNLFERNKGFGYERFK